MVSDKNCTMSINQAIVYGNNFTKNSCVHSMSDARLLLAYALGCDKLYLTVNRDKLLTPEQQARYINLLKRRAEGEPVSYITGEREFMSLKFYVDKNVLIPRPETELLVELVLDLTKDKKDIKILDLCTGSGAIAVSLSYYLKNNTLVDGADISKDALKIAIKNADLNKAKVNFFECDALNLREITEKYDVVVSNPPYIETDVIEGLDADVKRYEPHIALDGGSDGLDFYRKIIENSDKILKKGGLLAFEIGYNQARAVSDLMCNKFDNICVQKDLAGLNRIVYGYLKKE